MKRFFLPIFLLAFIFQLATVNCSAQYSNLLDFDGVTTGRNPSRGSLIYDNTYLYGMTLVGGANDSGAIFKIKPDGSGFSNLHDFSKVTGFHPYGSLFSDGTFLYGMTREGGANMQGTIFKIKPDGSGYTVIFDFVGALTGILPSGSFISDGTYLYGLAGGGGTNNMGVVFKIKPDGSNFTKLYDFAGASSGKEPRGSLLYDGAFLYGMTLQGGTSDSGVVFKIKPDGSGFSKLLDFSGANGSYPYGSLVSDGTYLYGLTSTGGANYQGTIFKIKPDGSGYVDLRDFQKTLNGLFGTPVLRGGFLYGMTRGGTLSDGSIFKIRTNGSGYTSIYSFSCPTDGCSSFGSPIADPSFLYGMTYDGGANNLGTVFKYQYCTPVASSQTVTLCAGQSLTVGIHTYTATNTYVDTLSTVVSGCDSVVTTSLMINPLPIVTANPITSTVCAGTNVTLTGGGAVSYAWNTGGTTTAITVKPTTSTGYTVTGTDANSCSNMATASITVNSLPVVSITGVTTICNGTSTTLTAAGAASYVWDTGSTTNAIAVSPTSSTGYTVTGTDANSCSNTVTRTVTVNYPVSTSQTITICAGQSITVGVNTYTATNTYVDILTSVLTGCDSTVTTNLINSGFTPSPISISGITTICKGSTTTLTATGVVSYVWTSGPSTDVYAVSPTTSKGYTVTGTDGNSCTSIATTTVTVNTLPAVSITGVTTICTGASTTLTATGAVSYAWDSGSTATSITVSPTSGTSYTVTGTDANTCVNTATRTVTVNSLPIVTANPITSTVCAGTNVTLTGGGAVSYAWNTGGTTTAITVKPTTSTGYTVTGTDANSCSNMATASITVNSLPVVSITGVTTICNGTSTTLTAAGAASYVWDTGSTTNAIAVSPTSSTGYTVTGTDANSCSNTVTRTVTVNYPVSTSQTITICAGQSITVGVNTYTATNTYVDILTSVLTGCDSTVTTNLINSGFTPSPISISGITTICKGSTTTLTATGVVSYVWTSGPSTDVYAVSPTTSKGYTVTGTDGNSCTSIATTTVTVNTLPAVSITGVTTICTGASTTLTATGAVSYAWDSGSTATSITVSPTSGTSYTVTGTDANTCVNTATRTVTVNSLPIVTANPITSTVCAGTNVTLTGGGAVSYAWNTGGTTTAITVKPTTSTGYTVTGTDANSCSNMATASITVNSLPVVSITGVTTICNGTSTTLTAAGAASYVWDTGSTTNAIAVSPTSSTGYTVTGTDANSCSNMATKTVIVNSLPAISITGVSTICKGNTTTLIGSGATTYIWSSGQSISAITVAPTTSTGYTVTGTDANSCSSTTTKIVTVNSLPSVTVNPLTSTVCSGTAVTLTAGGATSYVWSAGGTTTSIIISPTSSASYTVTGTNANNCNNFATTMVTVNSLPSVSITGSATICQGNTAILTGVGAVSYVWSTGSSTTAITVTPTASTGYTITGTDANSCSSTVTKIVTVNLLPTVSITGVTTICNGSTTTLTGNGAVSYAWNTGGTTITITVMPTTSTGYTVTGTDANSCSNIATKTVTVNSLPSIAITGVSTICKGNATTLISSGATTYVWSSGQSTSAITVAPTTSTTYTVTGTNATSCSSMATKIVTVNPVPVISISGTSAICIGSNTTLMGSGATTYVWSSGQSTSAITVAPTISTSYTVTGTNANSCSSIATKTVTVNPLPIVSVSGSTTICKGDASTLIGSGATTYVWSSGQSTSAIIVAPTISTSYTVTGTNGNSCSNTATKTITVNPLPDVTTSVTGVVISANQNSATYQWLDCNNGNLPITGATNQSYTATANGSYAVVVSLLTGCYDTSSCVVINDVGINEKVNHNLVIIVYPNPSTGIFTIRVEEKEYEVNICNFLGEKVFAQKIQNEKTEINLSNQPDGVYFLQVKTKHGMATKKLIIQK